VRARFYAPDAGAPGQIVTLSADEAEHLTKVLRLETGDAVRAFDGRGCEFDARVERASRAEVRLELMARQVPAAERAVAVTLAQAVLKGDRMDAVVRDAVMIGAAAIQPFVSARSETTVAALARGRRRDRWTRVAIASVKQCGRAVVPHVLEPCTMDEFMDRLPGGGAPERALMLVEPSAGAGAGAVGLAAMDAPPPDTAIVIAGPEGGWTSDEIARAAAVCTLVTLAGPTLRADAAPTVALAALYARWGTL
jgi:16S rRNA (uracil1498-N3)-methyltransferase